MGEMRDSGALLVKRGSVYNYASFDVEESGYGRSSVLQNEWQVLFRNAHHKEFGRVLIIGPAVQMWSVFIINDIYM